MDPGKERSFAGARVGIACLLIGVGFLALLLLYNPMGYGLSQTYPVVMSNVAAYSFILGGGYFVFLAVLWGVKEIAKAAAKGAAEGKKESRG